jgi:hypothetical protein
MKNITLGLRIFASIVIVFGVTGMYLVWNKIYEPGQIAEQQTDETNKDNGDDTSKPIVSDYVSPTSTDPTSPEHLEVPITPSENPKLVPTPDAITCDEIKEATFKKCRADCPAEPDIAVYNECTADCDKIGNLLTKSDCTNKCISDWSKAKSARSDCISSCLKDYYATDCP